MLTGQKKQKKRVVLKSCCATNKIVHFEVFQRAKTDILRRKSCDTKLECVILQVGNLQGKVAVLGGGARPDDSWEEMQVRATSGLAGLLCCRAGSGAGAATNSAASGHRQPPPSCQQHSTPALKVFFICSTYIVNLGNH